MSKFEKGVSGNIAGRKKGTKNRTTYEIRLVLQNLLDSNLDQLNSDLAELSPKDRISVLLKLADFVVPKAVEDDSESVYKKNQLLQEYLKKQNS